MHTACTGLQEGKSLLVHAYFRCGHQQHSTRSESRIMEQEDKHEQFLSKLIEERRKELDRVRSKEVVNVMLNRESLWAQIAANVDLKEYWRQEKERKAKKRNPTVIADSEATRKKILQDRKTELDVIRRQRHVRNKLKDPNTPVTARKMFKRKRAGYHRMKGANVLISDRVDQELTLMRQKSQTFVEHIFSVPHRSKRMLNRLSAAQIESIAASERKRVSKLSPAKEMSSDSSQPEVISSEKRNEGMIDQTASLKPAPRGQSLRKTSIPHLMEKLISREPAGGAIPESAFAGTDSEATPTPTPLPARKGPVEKDELEHSKVQVDSISPIPQRKVRKARSSLGQIPMAARHFSPAPPAALSSPIPPLSPPSVPPLSPDRYSRFVSSEDSEEFADDEYEETNSSASSSQRSSQVYLYSKTSSRDLLTQSSSEESGVQIKVKHQVLSTHTSITGASASIDSSSSIVMEQYSSSYSGYDVSPLLFDDVTSPPLQDFAGENPLGYDPQETRAGHYTASMPPQASAAAPRVRRIVAPPNEAMENPGFVTYIEQNGIDKPSREDYAIYKLTLFADDIEERRGEEIDRFINEMVIRAMKDQLNYSSFLRVIDQLVQLAKDMQEKALLIGIFGRTLSWKLPNLQEMIQTFTVQAMQDMANDFLSLVPVMVMTDDDPETELHDEGWHEILVKNSDDHLACLLDGDFMPPLEYDPRMNQHTPTHAVTIDRANPIRPDPCIQPLPAQPVTSVTINRGVSYRATSRVSGPPIRRSYSAEVLIASTTSSPSRERKACITDGEKDVDSPKERGKSVSPQRPRCKSESVSQTDPQKKKVSLSTAVVPYLPAATVAIHLGVYIVMKAFSN